MSHLDEGTLHALLDGELEPRDVREIQAHLGSCNACDSRLQAAKDVYGEADQLVTSIQLPGRLKSPGAGETDELAELEPEEAAPRAFAPPPRRERRIEPRPVSADAPPQVVILPEEYTWPERRRRWVALSRWAAVVCVAVGAGYIASEIRKGSGTAAPSSPRAVFDSDDGPAWVVSAEETAPPPEAVEPAAPPPAAAQSRTPAPAATPTPQPERQAPTETAPERRDDSARPTGAQTAQTEEEPEDAGQAAPSPDVRTEAAQALAELDRQRQRERAAAATAAIDRARRDAPRPNAVPPAESAPAPAPAPAPRTLEQRSGIYLRIGLDEAARQLGRPVHVIEGMSAQFMGLVQGQQSAGADASRPVVRVVYQDGQGRMMLLDQQRIRPGQNWPSGATQWVMGEIGLRLHGEAGPEVLRNFRPRVR